MKALIAVLLLMVVAVASSIVKVSDRGSRIARADTAAAESPATDKAPTKPAPPVPAESAPRRVDADRADSPYFISRKLQNLNATKLVESATRMFASDAVTWKVRVTANEATNSLAVSGPPIACKQVFEVVELADRLQVGPFGSDETALEKADALLKAGGPRLFTLDLLDADRAARFLEMVFPPTRDRPFVVHADSKDNQLYVGAGASVIDAVAKLLKKLDGLFGPPPRKDAANAHPGRSIFPSKRYRPDQLVAIVTALFESFVNEGFIQVDVDKRGGFTTVVGPAEMRDRVGLVVKLLDGLESDQSDQPKPTQETVGDQATLRTAKMLKLKFWNATSMADALRALYPDLLKRALISADPEGSNLWIRGDEQTLTELINLAQTMDDEAGAQQARLKKEEKPNSSQTKIFNLQNNQARTLMQTLQTLYPNRDGWIVADNRSNALIVHGSGEELREFEAVILRLDEQLTQTPQVPADEQSSGTGDEPPLPVDRRKLAQVYSNFDRRAAGLAAEFRNRKATAVDDHDENPELQRMTVLLRAAVTQAFDARQRWQAAELAVLRARLQHLERQVRSRAQAKPQIVERRVQELIQGKGEEGEADSSAPSLRPSAGGNSPSAATSVADRVRTALETSLAEAEVELVGLNIDIQTQREELERGVTFSDEAIEQSIAFDPEMQNLQVGLEKFKGRVDSLKPGSEARQQAEQTVVETTKKIAVRQSQLREMAAERLLEQKRMALKNSEASAREKERFIEKLKQKTREWTPSGADVSDARLTDQNHTAATASATGGESRGLLSAAPANGNALDAQTSTVAELKKRLVQAEVEMELERTNVIFLRENVERDVKVPRVSDEQVAALAAQDPELQQLDAKLSSTRQRAAANKPGSRSHKDLVSLAASLEQQIAAQKSEVNKLARKKVEADLRAQKRDSLANAEAELMKLERIVSLLKQKVNELSRPFENAGVVATLQQKIIDAQVDIELKSSDLQFLRKNLEEGLAGFQVADEELEKLVVSDPQFKEYQGKLQDVREKISQTSGKERETLEEDAARLERLLTAQRANILPELRRQARRIANASRYEVVEKMEADLENRKRYAEVIKEKLKVLLAGNEPAAEAPTADQYRRAAAVWMTDLEAAAAKAKELKRPLLSYIDPQTQTLELESQKEWMSQPEVLDLLEKHFVAVRTILDHNVYGDDARKFPMVTIYGFNTPKPGTDGEIHAGFAAFHYDKRFLDILRRIASEYDGVSKTDSPDRDSGGGKAKSAQIRSAETGENVLRDPANIADARQKLIDAEAKVKSDRRKLEQWEVSVRQRAGQMESLREQAKTDPSAGDRLRSFEPGANLLKLETENLKDQLAASEQQLEFARDNFASHFRLLELDLSAAELSQQQAERDLTAARSLLDKNLTSRDEFDKKVTALKSAELAVQRATIPLELYRRALGAKLLESGKPTDVKKRDEPPQESKEKDAGSEKKPDPSPSKNDQSVRHERRWRGLLLLAQH